MTPFATPIPDLLVLEPRVFEDDRGLFFESFNQRVFDRAIGHPVTFVQDNHSRSARHVLRGIHYQIRQAQGKLVRVVAGAVFDVGVDLRCTSPTFGRWYGVELSEQNRRQMWVPPGFGHAFLVISETADVLYKASDFYAPEHERTIAWDDAQLGVEWPLDGARPLVSDKDRAGGSLAQAEIFE